jgi:hypothetical protein
MHDSTTVHLPTNWHGTLAWQQEGSTRGGPGRPTSSKRERRGGEPTELGRQYADGYAVVAKPGVEPGLAGTPLGVGQVGSPAVSTDYPPYPGVRVGQSPSIPEDERRLTRRRVRRGLQYPGRAVHAPTAALTIP